MKLSFVLPTIFPTLAGGAIAAVREAAADIEHEIVVVSPFEISGPGVRWVRESDPRGSIAACNLGFKHATGDILVLIADDNRLDPGALQLALTHLETNEAQNPLLMVGFPLAVRGMVAVGSVYGRYYPYFFMLRRATLAKLGGGFDESYVKFHADPDLGLRCWAAGGRCEFAPGALIRAVTDRGGAGQAPDKAKGSAATDFARFAGIWGPSFPEWGTAQNTINLDIAVDLLPLMGGPANTVAAATRAQILDLRILAGLTMVGLNHGARVGPGRALQALEYLRWLASVAPDVLNVVVKNGIEASLARP
jgi:glycosyltransferase involved in cell wall biosynthesis